MRFSVRFAALVGALALAPAAAAAPIATDSFTNTTSQHQTIVEPDSFAAGSTIVGVAQAGRFFDGGASGISFATSTNNGSTWTSGTLPGITTFQGGAFDAATDPSIAYDAADNVWVAVSLGLVSAPGGPSGKAVVVSRSTDGGLTWGNPVTVASTTRRQDFDKTWIACDNTSTSPFYGSCYVQFDDFGSGNLLKMSYSRDGGQTWAASRTPHAGVIGGQPLVMSNGDVVVPLDNASETVVGYTISKNGGAKFGQAFVITPISASIDPGDIRSGPLPTAEIAGDDTIYVAWEDCRFRAGCPAAGTPNDIVYTTSSNGTTWSAVKRVPIDAVGSTVDHFLPGIAVNRATSGTTTNVGLLYYYYPNTSCTLASCQLDVGFVSSTNGGTSWSNPSQLAGPMTMSWLPDTSQGRMVGDYMSASFSGDGNVHPTYVLASAPTAGGSDCATATPNCNQALFSDVLTASGGSNTAAADAVVFNGSASPGASAFKKSR